MNSIATRTSFFSLLSNVLLSIIKFTAGILGNSYALIADAIESTTDIFGSLFVLFGLKYANRPPDKNHPYGHGRAEILVTFIVVGFLITSATIIAYESILHIQSPHEVPKSWTLYVLGAIIIWKELSFQYVSYKAKLIHSTALKAEAWHHRSDAITSVAAFIGISVAVGFGKGFESADDWAALVASIFIYYNSYKIFRPALGEMMDEHSYDELEKEIRKVATTVQGIITTEKCFIRKAGTHYHVDLHAVVNGELSVKTGHDLAHQLKDVLQKEIPQLGYVLIHIEPGEAN